MEALALVLKHSVQPSNDINELISRIRCVRSRGKKHVQFEGNVLRQPKMIPHLDSILKSQACTANTYNSAENPLTHCWESLPAAVQ